MVRICDYKNKAEDYRLIHYASTLQKLQRELRLDVSSFPDSGMIELSSDGISSSLPSLTSTDKGQQQCITKNNSNLSDPHGCIRYAKADLVKIHQLTEFFEGTPHAMYVDTC